MSRQVDMDNLSQKDIEYLVNFGKGHLVADAPEPDPGIELPADDPARAGQLGLQAQPDTGSGVPTDEQLRGLEPVNPEGYTAEDYEGWSQPDLLQEVKERNEKRADADGNQVEGQHPVIVTENNKKPTLVAALVADDERDKG